MLSPQRLGALSLVRGTRHTRRYRRPSQRRHESREMLGVVANSSLRRESVIRANRCDVPPTNYCDRYGHGTIGLNCLWARPLLW